MSGQGVALPSAHNPPNELSPELSVSRKTKLKRPVKGPKTLPVAGTSASSSNEPTIVVLVSPNFGDNSQVKFCIDGYFCNYLGRVLGTSWVDA